MDLHDVQNERPSEEIAVDEVGISGLLYPISVLGQNGALTPTTARISLSVDLPHHFKGTHMSRFVEVLNEHRGEVTMHTIPAILSDLRQRLEAERAQVDVRFPYFIDRTAPVSGAAALMAYECRFLGSASGAAATFTMGIRVPVCTLCPCSKEISDYGAHSQRGYVDAQVRTRQAEDGSWAFVWLEELIEVAESSASGPVYSLLKRPDERYVTMHAYENPAFVEDVVRRVASRLSADPRIGWFRVRVENQESIHNHDAFAVIERGFRVDVA